MKKIMIIGSSGSGKTHLSRELGSILNIDPAHLDEYFWQSNWQIIDHANWQGIVDSLTSSAQWIIDGNYIKAIDTRIILSDTIILLDFSRWYCLMRIVKRHFKYRGRSRPGMHPGCLERWNWKYAFTVYNFKKSILPILFRRIGKHDAEKKLIVLRNIKDVQRFVQRIKETGNLEESRIK